MWFRRTRTCGFCAKRFPANRAVCPGCSYPADGDLAGRRPGDDERPAERRGAAECPTCGGRFAAGRPACPHCGSDASTGWKSGDEIDYQSLDVPDAFDDDAYREAVSGLRGGSPGFWRTAKTRRMAVGILIVLAMTVPALVLLWRIAR